MDHENKKNNEANLENNNVVSIFSAKQTSCTSNDQNTGKKVAAEELFAKTMEKNAANAKRLRDSRIKANRGVLRSYRIKK